MRREGAIVTCRAGGMGRAMCERLVRHGAKLTVADLSAAAAQRTAEALRAAGGEAIAVDPAGILFETDAA